MKKSCFMVVLIFLINSFCVSLTSAAQLYGDLNSDGSVNSLDFGIYRRYLLGMGDLNDIIIADLNGDGNANSIDFAYLRQYLLGQIKVFPVEGIVTPTPTDTPITPTPDPEAWKNNTGTIKLGNTITYTGEGIQVDGSVVKITSGGDHDVSGTLTNGMIYINTKEKVKLRLSGVNITNSNGPAIYFDDVDKAFITISNNTVNYLSDGSTYIYEDAKGTLFSNDNLEIKGKGTLNIISNYGHGIASDDNISIENGNISVKAVKDGLHSKDELKISGGNIYIEAESDAIDAGEEIDISDGTVIAIAKKAAFVSETELIITGGTIISTGSYDLKPSSNSTQPSLHLGLDSSKAAGTLFRIENNTVGVLTFAPSSSYNQLFFSSPILKAGTTYNVNIGGSSNGTSTNGIYVGGTYTPGSTNLTTTAALIP